MWSVSLGVAIKVMSIQPYGAAEEQNVAWKVEKLKI
jgi:hypothetical protein